MPLAPLTPGSIIGRAFSSLGEHWKPLLGISAVFTAISFVAGLLIGLAAGDTGDTMDPDTSAMIAVLVGTGLYFIVWMAMTGALTRLVASEVAGAPGGVAESLRYGLRHLGSILVVGLLLFAILFVEILVGSLFAGALHAPFLLFFVLLGALFLGLTLSMSIPALVIENKRGSEALSRSWALIMSAFGHSLGTLALTFLVLVAGSIAVGVVGTAGDVMSVIANLVLQVISLPFVSLVLVLLYVNLRVKAGGITKDSLRAELRATGPTPMP
ncbi:MAG TPA: hypothetical protein VLB31_08285 [Actinomycetota bacterium]|nr:hypothetical protein [Actinomycetota bacterium]